MDDKTLKTSSSSSSSSATTCYEPLSTYYLHPSESTHSIISPTLLRGDNYDEWVHFLSNNLRAKNNLGFIDGT